MFTTESHDPFLVTRLRHEHPPLHPNHIGLVRIAHALGLDDLDALDRQLEDLTAQRRSVVDRLAAYRCRLWPRVTARHQRRSRTVDHDPFPPAAVDAEPLSGIDLRRVAVAMLARHGALPLRELHGLLHRYGYVIESRRPVQRLADALAYEVRHGRVDRVSRGVYAACVPEGTSPDNELRAWASPASPGQSDRAIDPDVVDDPERWSGRTWPASAQAGTEWLADLDDPFVADLDELAADLDETVRATRSRMAELHAERLGPPPPRNSARGAIALTWARTYPLRNPTPGHIDSPPPPPDDFSTFRNDSSTNRSGSGGSRKGGEGEDDEGDVGEDDLEEIDWDEVDGRSGDDRPSGWSGPE